LRSASSAIRRCFVDTRLEFPGIRGISQQRFHGSASRFPPRGPRRSLVPPLLRYYQDATIPCRPSRRTSLPSFGGTTGALVRFAPDATECCGARAWSWSPGTSGRGALPWRRQGLPSSWGTSISVCPCSQTPAGRTPLTRDGASAWSPLETRRRRRRETDFRGSIAWLSGSLSTYHVTVTRLTAQDSLPGAGQALLDGLPTRKVPLKGFKLASCSLSPFPKLAWHKPLLCSQLRRSTYSVSDCDCIGNREEAPVVRPVRPPTRIPDEPISPPRELRKSFPNEAQQAR